MRLSLVLAVVAACLAPAVAAAQAPPPLSPERYAALEPVLMRLVDLDDRDAGEEELEALREVCTALTTTDVLLASQRASCLASVKQVDDDAVVGARLDKCKSKRCAARYTRKGAQTVDRTLRALRRANGTVRTEVPDAACAAALLTPESVLRWMARYSAAMRAVAKATLGRSERLLERRIAALDRVAGAFPKTPSGSELLAAFRRDCSA